MRSPYWFSFVLSAALGAALVGCSGEAGPAGPKGDPGTGTGAEASVSAVIPNKVFLDRSVDVSISGFGTSWTDAAMVDFGAGIKVNSAVVASPTAIVANVTVDPTAATGPRDVTVTEGAQSAVFKGAFRVEPVVSVTLAGSVAQGSLVSMKASMNDIATPFDPVSLEVLGDIGTTIFVQGAEAYSLDLVLGIDVDATVGSHEITIKGGAAEGQENSYKFDVAARKPTVLASGVDAAGKVDNPFDSTLYSFAPGAGLQAVSITSVAGSTDALPGFVLVPGSGVIADFISYTDRSDFLSNNGDSYYVIYWDDTGVAPYEFTLSASAKAPALGTDMEPNNTLGQAQSIASLPFVLQNANIASDTDEDWFKFTAQAGDLGRCLHVSTSPGDDFTDTLLDVFHKDGTTTLGGPSDDANYHEDFISAPLNVAEVYYVTFYASPIGYSPTQTKYDALINIIDCPPKD